MVRSSIAATDCSLSSASRGVASSSRSVSRRTITSAPSRRCDASSHAARKRADARRLLDEGSALRRRRLDDAVDIVLHHHRVAVLGEPGAAEQTLEIAQPGVVAVDAELGVPFAACDPPADRHLGILGRQAAVLVVHDELDLGEPHALTAAAARVDDLVHALAAELAGVRLAERPAHGIDEVALAAAVRPDDRGDPRVEDHLAPSREGLEPGQGDPPEPHPGDCPRAERGTSTSWAAAISRPQDLVLTPRPAVCSHRRGRDRRDARAACVGRARPPPAGRRRRLAADQRLGGVAERGEQAPAPLRCRDLGCRVGRAGRPGAGASAPAPRRGAAVGGHLGHPAADTGGLRGDGLGGVTRRADRGGGASSARSC